jgi:hypothetical protein
MGLRRRLLHPISPCIIVTREVFIMPVLGTVKSSSASPNGTIISSATSFTDTDNAVWTMDQGMVFVNGQPAGNTSNVTLMIWLNATVYCRGTDNVFYLWTGAEWMQCLDPLLGGVSVDGTTIPPAQYIVDKTEAIWTLDTGVIYRNSETVGETSNVTLVLWYGGKVYHENSSGQWFVNASTPQQWLSCGDPRVLHPNTRGRFYGINGHYDYTYTEQQIVTILQQLGCTIYRLGTTADPTQLDVAVRYAQAFQQAGLTLFTLVNLGLLESTGGPMYTDENAAYQSSFKSAAAVATALQPYGVTLYECGNELTRDPAMIVDPNSAGNQASDFNNTNWPIMRGVMRGMIDGVKSVQPDALCGINFCVADIGAADALWEGMQPDGTSGYEPLHWDITTWHNYEVYGDIFAIGTDGQGPTFDLPSYAQARYDRPFMITEWNTGSEQSGDYNADYITRTLSEYFAERDTHCIESVMLYVLDSGDQGFGIMFNGEPVEPEYSAFVDCIAAHPDV